MYIDEEGLQWSIYMSHLDTDTLSNFRSCYMSVRYLGQEVTMELKHCVYLSFTSNDICLTIYLKSSERDRPSRMCKSALKM